MVKKRDIFPYSLLDEKILTRRCEELGIKTSVRR